MNGGIIELDVHGMRTAAAKAAIDRQLASAGPGVYRIRIVHGYNGGTRIRGMIREEYSYGREPRVRRVEMGGNQGITELVLREY